MRTRNEVIVRNRKLMLIAALIFSFIFAFIFFSNRAAAENSQAVYTYFTSYEIQSGDTLWTISDKFMTAENSDRKAFIKHIKELNHLSSDEITAGNYLIIEYSSFEEL